jgi:L-ascorbate metabolism protein UlaG (beta-lactamase superfamily)
MNIDGIEIKWLGHAGFLIKNSKIIYIDPYNIKEGTEKADLIFITHSHYDHCSLEDIQKIVKEDTKIICPADCQSKITKLENPVDMILAEPNNEFDFGEVKVSTLPAYNIDKPFHSKEELWVGYVIKMNGIVVYHAGDTDKIPEMQNLTGHNQANKKLIALLPVGGKYTMNSEEAVEAAKTIKPFLAIPMHYGTIVGTEEDAKDFSKACEDVGIRTNVLNKE